MSDKSRLQTLLERGEFVVTAEVGPPKSASSKGLRKHTAHLKDATDALNVTDNQTAVVRLSSLAGSLHVLAEGAEPIFQMTCRDRNRIAMQSDVLGAYSLGIRNILCLTGDHQSFGNHPQARGVFDLDSIQLIRAMRDLRDEGRFISGDTTRFPARMFIGAAENPFGDPYEYRVLRLKKKIDAGADFIQTQAVFDVNKFAQWMESVREAGLHQQTHITAGVIPAKSAGAFRYMQGVPGLSIPQQLIDRAAGADDAAREGVKICIETIQQLREIEGVKGVHIMAIAWEEVVPEIVEGAGLLPRPTA